MWGYKPLIDPNKQKKIVAIETLITHSRESFHQLITAIIKGFYEEEKMTNVFFIIVDLVTLTDITPIRVMHDYRNTTLKNFNKITYCFYFVTVFSLGFIQQFT